MTQQKVQIYIQENPRQFHLTNGQLSYIFQVAEDGKLLQLYYGAALPDRSYAHLLELHHRPMSTYRKEGDLLYSLEHVKQEFPEYGTTDFRHPAIILEQENGSRITDLTYQGYEIQSGKPALAGLPATYVEADEEAQTLILYLKDRLTQVEVRLLYTLFADQPVLARSVQVTNQGPAPVQIQGLMSLSLDLPDCDYDWVQLSGSWARERQVRTRHLEQGIQSISSTRGVSSHQHNPFVALKRPHTTEQTGPVIGATLVYSGNFLVQAEVDTYEVTRLQLGIHPFGFSWKLDPGASFTSPEALLVYSEAGLNGMSAAFHQLFRTRLARGYWRDRPRPVLINNWEATYFDFDEDKLLSIVKKAKEVGVELFVLDDGWFGERTHDRAGLGDWQVNRDRLPQGIGSLSERIHQEGLRFGLWFEPEMVNKDSDLYRSHPDWILQVPDRQGYHGRNQYVLDFSRREVVDHLFQQMTAIIDEAQLDYIKWDMNRPLTDVYSIAWPADQQGEIAHRYVLGVYDLYERLIQRYPALLFESCASGGGRFDAGLLYYAPQAWTSDDTDAIDRLKIQYGTSYLYPLSTMGAHVSTVPNHQTNRLTPLSTRANVAFFGVFGYELDLNQLTPSELQQVKEQIRFYKAHRTLLQTGRFYRLLSPFEGKGATAWMVVSPDQKQALVGFYKGLNEVNAAYRRLYLQGLDPTLNYQIGDQVYSGQELLSAGLVASDASSGQLIEQTGFAETHDFDSWIWFLEAKED